MGIPQALRAFTDHQKLGCPMYRVPCSMLSAGMRAKGVCFAGFPGMPSERLPSAGSTRGDRSGQPQAAARVGAAVSRSVGVLASAVPLGFRAGFPPDTAAEMFRAFCQNFLCTVESGKHGCKGRWCKSRDEPPGLQPSL